LEKKFSGTQKRFTDSLNQTRESIESEIKTVELISKKLSEIDNYGLERLSETLKKIISLVETDKELVRLVLENKK
jgi:hypothetical protein